MADRQVLSGCGSRPNRNRRDADSDFTSKGEKTDAVDCTLAKLTFTDKGNFTYGSEIVFKNSNFGWAVWTRNHREGTHRKIPSYSGLFTTTLKKGKSVLEGGNIIVYGNKLKDHKGRPIVHSCRNKPKCLLRPL